MGLVTTLPRALQLCPNVHNWGFRVLVRKISEVKYHNGSKALKVNQKCTFLDLRVGPSVYFKALFIFFVLSRLK